MKTLQDHINFMQGMSVECADHPWLRDTYMAKGGFTHIGGGCTRRCWRHGDSRYIIKISHGTHERGSHAVYVRAPRFLKRMLVPTLASGQCWSIQPYVRPCRETKKDYELCPSFAVYNSDNHCGNHTHDGGRMRIFDYHPGDFFTWEDEDGDCEWQATAW